jgi:uncharacterized protein involved in tolerance to divalent cations
MKRIIQIITTLNSKETVERIGRQLLEKRLVSCVQIMGSIKSIYKILL